MVFSATTKDAVANPPSEVMIGRSFTGATSIVIVFGAGSNRVPGGTPKSATLKVNEA